jgi:hypothetical protein
MAISSNSLIHLTKHKDALIGILTDNFRVKYCVEKLSTPVGILSYAVPMVSFCDIPLSEIKAHIQKYGSYGIGLTKRWGQSANLNPVFYVDKNSSIGKNYHEAFIELFKNKGLKVNAIEGINSNLLDVFRYMKNYESDLERDDDIIRDYRFADEKEWRFVPTREQINYMVIRASAYLKNKGGANEMLENLRLYFEPEDIKYIIINHDHEIKEFIDILRNVKGTKYAYNDVERLVTRIITVEQILSDF